MTYEEEISVRRLVNDLGGVPEGGSGVYYNRMVFTGNGLNTVFDLTVIPNSDYIVFVYLNGVLQLQTTDYSISNNLIIFVVAPANNDEIVAQFVD